VDLRIKILTTGGTIASKFDRGSGGAIPVLSGEELVKTVPSLDTLGTIEIESICNVPGDHIGPEIWKRLAVRVSGVLKEEDVQGVVITHGTDTLEETAYFLDLTVASSKPVVLTGALRNASEWDCDGPRNILNGVRIVTDRAAVDMGVMVALNGQICAAVDAIKTHTHAVETYAPGRKGFLGEVVGDRVEFYRKRIRRLHFPVDAMGGRVDIIPMYAGADGRYIDFAVESGVSGIVIQALGLGNVNVPFYQAIRRAIDRRVVVVIASRAPYGHVVPTYAFEGGGVTLQRMGAVFAGDLAPWKARILLSLAVGTTKDNGKIQGFFDSH
jgi:L-asparaginase